MKTIGSTTFATEFADFPVAPFYVVALDSFMSGWGHGLPEENWTVIPCATEELARIAWFNCAYCRPEMSRVELFKRGEPRYKLPRDEKLLAAKLEPYKHSIVGGVMAMCMTAGGGLYEWLSWKERACSVITGEAWFRPGLDNVYEDEEGQRFRFLNANTAHFNEPGDHYLRIRQEIDKDQPKQGRSFERRTVWRVRKAVKSEYAIIGAKVELVKE